MVLGTEQAEKDFACHSSHEPFMSQSGEYKYNSNIM